MFKIILLILMLFVLTGCPVTTYRKCLSTGNECLFDV